MKEPVNPTALPDSDWRTWMLRVVSWDGVLPAAVIVSAGLVKTVFPNQPRVVEYSLLCLAVTVFLLRLRIGLRQIETNDCRVWTRRGQYVVFLISIMLLAVLEFILMLVPVRQWFAVKEDRVIWAILFAIYFGGMTFAWYPGRPIRENSEFA